MKPQFSPAARRKPGGCGGERLLLLTAAVSICSENGLKISRGAMQIGLGGCSDLLQKLAASQCAAMGFPIPKPAYRNASASSALRRRNGQSLTEHTAEITFDDAPRTIAPGRAS